MAAHARTIVVTGAGRGIGRAIAEAFAAPDVAIGLIARTRDELERTADLLSARGATPIVLPADVREDVQLADAFGALRRSTDRIDLLVNNAGAGGGQPVDRTDPLEWRRVLDTNVWGMFLATRFALPLLVDGGRIVNMSSVLGRFGVAGYTAYCASKHAVIGFTRALALELVERRITVNAICPGWVETGMAVAGMHAGASATGTTYEEFRATALGRVPIKRIIQPAEVAELVKFLASPEAAAITGQTYNICGGQTMD